MIAFLDDDEEAPSGWLAALVGAQRLYDADVVFGPVHARADWDRVGNRVYFERFFSRLGPEASGPIDRLVIVPRNGCVLFALF